MNPIAAIGYNLANLANFRGRETQGQFWPYAGIVLFGSFAGIFAIMIPQMTDTFDRMQRFAVEHPESATIESGPGTYSISIQGYHPELMPSFTHIAAGAATLVAVVAFLLAAAITRRLHDRGKSGLWALLPLLFLALGFAGMPMLFTQAPPNMALFLALFLNNALYLASLAYLFVVLAMRGTRGDNRFGAVVRPG